MDAIHYAVHWSAIDLLNARFCRKIKNAKTACRRPCPCVFTRHDWSPSRRVDAYSCHLCAIHRRRTRGQYQSCPHIYWIKNNQYGTSSCPLWNGAVTRLFISRCWSIHDRYPFDVTHTWTPAIIIFIIVLFLCLYPVCVLDEASIFQIHHKQRTRLTRRRVLFCYLVL